MGDLLVLCYHGISETWPAPTTVRPGDFESQLEHFLGRGYVGATLTEAHDGEGVLVASGPWEGREDLANQAGFRLISDDETGEIELVR